MQCTLYDLHNSKYYAGSVSLNSEGQACLKESFNWNNTLNCDNANSFQDIYHKAQENNENEKANNSEKANNAMSTCEALEYLLETNEKLKQKIKNGDLEPHFQIGSVSFTNKEWNKLLSNIDDILEDVKEQIKELREHEEEEKEKQDLRLKASNAYNNFNIIRQMYNL